MDEVVDSIRVAVIDDHPLFRDGVAHTLRTAVGVEVVGEGATAGEAIRIAQDKLPDIVLLDISLPGDGLEVARVISTTCPFIKTIMLTASESEEHVAAALRSGARGYILKGIGSVELIQTIRAVQNGESLVTPALAARLLVQMKQKSAGASNSDDLPSLTVREEQILKLVSRGLTNKEIAREIDLSEKTIKHYMTNIMQKLQVRNRVEAVLLLQRKRSC